MGTYPLSNHYLILKQGFVLIIGKYTISFLFCEWVCPWDHLLYKSNLTNVMSCPFKSIDSCSLCCFVFYYYHDSITFYSTMLKYSSNPCNVPANSLLLFITIHILDPTAFPNADMGSFIDISYSKSKYYIWNLHYKFRICEIAGWGHQRVS